MNYTLTPISTIDDTTYFLAALLVCVVLFAVWWTRCHLDNWREDYGTFQTFLYVDGLWALWPWGIVLLLAVGTVMSTITDIRLNGDSYYTTYNEKVPATLYKGPVILGVSPWLFTNATESQKPMVLYQTADVIVAFPLEKGVEYPDQTTLYRHHPR